MYEAKNYRTLVKNRPILISHSQQLLEQLDSKGVEDLNHTLSHTELSFIELHSPTAGTPPSSVRRTFTKM